MPEPSGGLGLLDRVLAYADKPWKIAAIGVLALIGLIAVTVWEKRAEIAEAVLHSTVLPRLKPQRFDAIARGLVTETHADLVVLARVSIANNLISNLDARYPADPKWRPRPDVRAVFGSQITLAQVAAAIEGQVICEDVPSTDGGRIDVDLGMTRRCWVGVPPIPEVLVGVLGIAWTTPPDPQLEAGARNELRRQAMKLATW